MKIILSPAKSMNFDIDTKQLPYSNLIYKEEVEELVKKLKKFSVKEIERLMKVSNSIATLNHGRYQKFHLSNKISENTKQAGAIFTGEVFRGLDFNSLSDEQITIAQKKIRILSGLYGILKPLDLIYPYRLEMGTRWEINHNTKNLYQFWNDKLSKSLNNEMGSNEPLINLASNEYFKAIDKTTLKSSIITLSFKDNKNGVYKTVMTFAKKARGRMARFIIENNINNPEDIKSFQMDNYIFNPQQSTENNWVFTRG